MTYRWTALTHDTTPAWADLITTLAVADDTEEFYSAEDLAEELDSENISPAEDTWAVWDGEQMVGFGGVTVSDGPDSEGFVRIQLQGGVRPTHRRQGIGRALMDRMEERGSVVVGRRHPGVPARIRSTGGVEGADVRRLLEARGYTPVRWFSQMQRALPGDALADLPVPDDLRLVSPTDDLIEPLWHAHAAAFADHWGYTPMSLGRFREMMTSRSARPALSTVALEESGTPIAYVLTAQWVDREAYVTLVATHPGHRGRGIASLCLARCIRAAATSGEYDLIELHVDSASPTGADRLYQRLGFERRRMLSTYTRALGETPDDPGTVGA